MTNQRLRTAMVAAGFTPYELAAHAQVDPKTVERWLREPSRKPHRATRQHVAKILGVDEAHLWPALADDIRTAPLAETEIVHVYPTRSAVSYTLWAELLNNLADRMDVLVYSGQFLVEQHNLLPIVRDKVRDGVTFRFLVGDETSPAVIQRAAEEGTSGGLEGRVQMMRRYLREVADLPGVEVRSHGTILYNSVYRFDDQLLVNGHAYGALAGQNPVIHLRRIEGGQMWNHYMNSFSRVWEGAECG